MYSTASNRSGGERASRSGKTARPRILVVEDEVLLSLEIAQVLFDAGFAVVGPARSVAQALELTRRAGCQAAVLDFGLGRGTSEPIAQELVDHGTPFVTLSGHPANRLPSIFNTAPFIAKPLRAKLLVHELRRCLAVNAAIA